MFFFFFIIFQACLSEEQWDFLQQYFVYNSSSAHPETILYCAFMSKYSTYDMRFQAFNYIIRARYRNIENPPQRVRLFKYPDAQQINFDAETIMELLDFDELERINPSYITEPPLLKLFGQLELMEILQASDGPNGINPLDYLARDGDQKMSELGKKLSAIKCHSMYNEKAVQQTTKAVKKNIGHEKQRGAVVVTKDSVDQIPITAKKSHFSRKLDFD